MEKFIYLFFNSSAFLSIFLVFLFNNFFLTDVIRLLSITILSPRTENEARKSSE